MVKKNQSKNIEEANNNMEVESNSHVNVDIPVFQKTTIIGFDTDHEMLAEINSRFSSINRNCFLMKKIPKNLTRISLKQMIPEMISCRFPLRKNGKNKGYAFIQMKNENMVDKYIEMFNKNQIKDITASASKTQKAQQYADLSFFDMKTLFFNGIKPSTKLNEVKEAYPNAKILFPTNKDKSAQGSFTLIFSTELEAKEAFAENKLTLDGVKIQLNYLVKSGAMKSSKKDMEQTKPVELSVTKQESEKKETNKVRNAGKRKLDDDEEETLAVKKVRLEVKENSKRNVAERKTGKRKLEETEEQPAKKMKQSSIPKRTIATKTVKTEQSTLNKVETIPKPVTRKQVAETKIMPSKENVVKNSVDSKKPSKPKAEVVSKKEAATKKENKVTTQNEATKKAAPKKDVDAKKVLTRRQSNKFT